MSNDWDVHAKVKEAESMRKLRLVRAYLLFGGLALHG